MKRRNILLTFMGLLKKDRVKETVEYPDGRDVCRAGR